MDALRQAAQIMSDQFSASVLHALQENPPRKFLYAWEMAALEWLREQQKRDPQTVMCAWTSSYLEKGPPPWRDQQPI